ncbi:hypothetical protein TNCV_1266701 [Trichonephila clavipes]|nr:hypothetical protein TNCV_1266701 [Trichonephila clavipes]
MTIGEACIQRIMSSFLVSREWDNRNRWRDGQVCPDVGQGVWRLGPDGPVVAREAFSARLSSLIIPALWERQCLQTTIFMQKGATPHIGHQVKALLSANFGDNRDYPYIFWVYGLLAHQT